MSNSKFWSQSRSLRKWGLVKFDLHYAELKRRVAKGVVDAE
jgi:hypothetical protein